MIKVKFRHEYKETEEQIPLDGNKMLVKKVKHYYATTCRIFDDDVELAFAQALLSSNDQFSRVYGRSLAYWRAVDAFVTTDPDDEKIKSRYRQIRKGAAEWLEKHNTKVLPLSTFYV